MYIHTVKELESEGNLHSAHVQADEKFRPPGGSGLPSRRVGGRRTFLGLSQQNSERIRLEQSEVSPHAFRTNT